MKDLRTFIEDMEERHPGEILRVQRPVDARFEISSVIRRLQEERKFPAVFFESVRGSDHGVITNVHATRERMVYGMGVSDRKAMLRAWSERLDNPIAPIDVETGPVKEVIHLGEAIELAPAETVDVPVPARAEIAIEGKILAGVREDGLLFNGLSFFGTVRGVAGRTDRTLSPPYDAVPCIDLAPEDEKQDETLNDEDQ